MPKASGNPESSASARKRVETSEDGDERMTKKRSRGRPRLETSDETAAERRRTQIRLAQRAYRNRKDTAIDTLKNRVKELEQVNEDMGREFMNLSDFFFGQGMLQASPEVARRLNDATRRFLALSRKATEDSTEDETTAAPDVPEQEPRLPQGNPKRSLSDSTSSSGDTQSTPNTELGPDDASLSGIQGLSDLPQHFNPLTHTLVSSITNPSFKDASFPVLDAKADVALFATSYTHSPFNTLPVPESYAFHERSFGRRFQRATVEAGLALALMENPPPDRYMAVFSFCLQFESRQQIIRRLSVVLDRTRNESLNNWKYPFSNLGGAGTWMSQPDSTGKLFNRDITNGDLHIGNHGLPQHDKPHNMTGLSTGPFSEDVELARDIRVDHRMRMLYPGFEGDFFDADEVDAYLHQRGIVIPEGKDYVEAEIDIDVFERPPDLPPRDFGPKRQEFFRKTPAPRNGPDLSSLYSTSFETTTNTWDTTTTTTVEASILMNDPLAPQGLDPQLESFGADLDAANESQFNQGLPSFEDMSEIPWRIWEPPSVPVDKKTKVTIDVNRLVTELVNAAVCLGRSPGIRPNDVHRAVKLSIALQHG
ncbi:hypothetical protein B0T10DRAFT_72213 [Thelonectria olida]|uniref:BZIP domain-containing protein n=1 Tax=Thelonectria olida TaxID=1576542 RepID=A0A9P9AKM4_9HYPO|nr:hypothetical protein B0T10DRAFT_72213 [Thelonectria olida]